MKYIKLVTPMDGTLLIKIGNCLAYIPCVGTDERIGHLFFVPATGEPFSTVPQAIKALPFLRYVITSNGAAIYDAVEKKPSLKIIFSPNAVDTVVPIAKHLPVGITGIFYPWPRRILRKASMKIFPPMG